MQARAGVQAGALQGIDLVEDAQAALHHQAQLPPRAAGQAVDQGGAMLHAVASPAGAVGNQARGFGGALQCVQLRRVGAVAGAVGVGQVMAAAGDVHAQVLPEVDQLQGGADGVAFFQRLRAGHAIQVQQQTAHGVGGAAAIVQQLGAVGVALGVAGFLHVLDEGAEQVVEQRHRQRVRAQHGLQRAEHSGPLRCGRLACGYPGQFGAVGGKVSEALRGRCVALVGNVVCRAGKGVDGCNGLAQVRRAQQRGHGEVFVVRDGRRHHRRWRLWRRCSTGGRSRGGSRRGGGLAWVHGGHCRLTLSGRPSRLLTGQSVKISRLGCLVPSQRRARFVGGVRRLSCAGQPTASIPDFPCAHLSPGGLRCGICFLSLLRPCWLRVPGQRRPKSPCARSSC